MMSQSNSLQGPSPAPEQRSADPIAAWEAREGWEYRLAETLQELGADQTLRLSPDNIVVTARNQGAGIQPFLTIINPDSESIVQAVALGGFSPCSPDLWDHRGLAGVVGHLGHHRTYEMLENVDVSMAFIGRDNGMIEDALEDLGVATAGISWLRKNPKWNQVEHLKAIEAQVHLTPEAQEKGGRYTRMFPNSDRHDEYYSDNDELEGTVAVASGVAQGIMGTESEERVRSGLQAALKIVSADSGLQQQVEALCMHYVERLERPFLAVSEGA